MQEAVNAVVNGTMGYKKASIQYNVPQTTLERHVKKKRENPDYAVCKTMGRFVSVFTPDQEAELADYLTKMEARLFGLTINELRELAYELACRNNLSHPFGEEGKAGIEWVRGFMARHPTLSLRKPEATSAARAMGFNKPVVDKFFDLLTNIIDTYKLTGDRIFNSDETGISVNPKDQSKIIAKKGRRQVGTLTSAERGETVTVEVCFSAAGNYVPPMIIFPRKRMRQEFETGLPPGAKAAVHETGWMTKELFLEWLKHFISFTGVKKDRPVLLILDGHSTHTKSLELIDLARENGVIMLCLPPHTSHRLQPLDVAYMKPLSKFYEDEIRKWLRSNPGKVVTLFQIASLFGAAYLNTSTMSVACNGFKKCGIWPADRNVFDASDFLPSATTDIELADDLALAAVAGPSTPVVVAAEPSTPTGMGAGPPTPAVEAGHSTPAVVAGPSTHSILSISTSQYSPNFTHVSPTAILPVPKVAQKNKRLSSNRGSTVILTSSPYKLELTQAQEKKEKKEREKEEKRTAKRQLDLEQGSAVHKCPAQKSKKTKKLKKAGPGGKKMLGQKPKYAHSSDSEEIEEEDDCLYCHDYSEEGWIRCASCLNWAHNSCAGIDEEDEEAIHICILCE